MDSETKIKVSVINNKESLLALFLTKYAVSSVTEMNANEGIISVLNDKIFVRYLGEWKHVITFNQTTKRYFIVTDSFLDILAYIMETFNSEVDPTTISSGTVGQLIFYLNSGYIFNGETWEVVFLIEEIDGTLPITLTGALSLEEIETRTILLITQQVQELIPIFIGVINQQKGQPNGIASLDGDGKVPSTQIPTVPLSATVDWTYIN